MKDKISVVVPIYNVEKYLDKCVESIVGQTYRNLEIILVDDGSTDCSGIMCDTWAEKDNRICVIHKENGGLSDARNKGIDIATGKWIGFVDSDDYIDATMFEKLYYACVDNNCHISSCGFKRVFDKGRFGDEWTTKEDMLLNRDEMMEYLYLAAVGWGAWNKLYDITLFDDIRYPYGKTREDEFTTYKIFCKTEKLYYIHECLYFYYQRENSITGIAFSIKNLDSLEALEQAMQYHEENDNENYYQRALQEYIRLVCEFAVKNNCQSTEKNKINQILREDAKRILKNNKVSFMAKIKLLTVAYCTEGYKLVVSVSRRMRGFQ